MIELLTQLWPEGWSGNPGVLSAGVVGVDGSNSGNQFASPSVAGLPSASPFRIASTSSQKSQ